MQSHIPDWFKNNNTKGDSRTNRLFFVYCISNFDFKILFILRKHTIEELLLHHNQLGISVTRIS